MSAEYKINGQTIKMISRKCRGCAKSFRVNENSKQKYHSAGCADFHGKNPGSMAPEGHEEALIIPKSGIIWTDEI